jgi:hypothetical protein
LLYQRGTHPINPLCPNYQQTLTIKRNWFGRPDFVCEKKGKGDVVPFYLPCYSVSLREIQELNQVF